MPTDVMVWFILLLLELSVESEFEVAHASGVLMTESLPLKLHYISIITESSKVISLEMAGNM